MAALTTDTPASVTETAVRMLEYGHELITQLRHLLLLQVPPESIPDLPWALLDSFSDSVGLAISVIRSWDRHKESRDRQAAQSDRSVSSDDDQIRSKCPSRKRSRVQLMAKGEDDRKRRKHAYSSRMVTTAPYDDGFLWRKYGQKAIRSSNHPRCYFRCTYSNDEGCPATKQVQQIDNNDSPKFLIIYTYKHTCANGQCAPHVIVESTPTEQFSLSYASGDTVTPVKHPLSSEVGEKQGNRHEAVQATPSGRALFPESELMEEPMWQFWTNTPEIPGAQQPVVSPPSPQITAIDKFVDWLLSD
ncbi:hypothetical protein Taro_035162 [Colocasia esculenta]|uniref:WRKY domain-containing protein n=1 Tax=Colocasia esculenta TaxID=4460 RepID=A0A843WE27_COLES|nr:hypothetical protein [Colocasia esculenta]